MTVKVKFAFVALIFVTFGDCTSRDEIKCQMLVNQLTKLEGISKFNILIENSVKSAIVDELLVKLTRVIPCLPVKNDQRFRNKTWVKYAKKNIRSTSKYYNKSRQQEGIVNHASGNSLFIYFCRSVDEKSLDIAMWYYHCFTCISSVPKFLIVVKVDKVQVSYKKTMTYLLRRWRIIDVDIMEISKSGVNIKRRLRKRQIHNFMVHQYNPFSKSYMKRVLSKNVKWFQSKLMNLHRHKLFINKLHFERIISVANKKNFIWTSDRMSEKSKLGIHLRTSMNLTYVYAKEIDQELKFLEVQMCGYYRIVSLKPILFHTHHIYTPVIFDKCMEINLQDFFIFFPPIIFLAFLLKLLTKFSEFNPQTWSMIATFQMLLGLGNPSGRITSALEASLFILMLFAGFFYSTLFSESATNILNPYVIERQFNSWSDMKDSNLTVCLIVRPTNRTLENIPMDNPILESKVKIYMLAHNTLKQINNMFLVRDRAVSLRESPLSTSLFNSMIAMDGQVLARRSGLTELMMIVSLQSKQFSPYIERMSDLYWRFHETGFHNFMGFVEFLYHHNREQTIKCYTKMPQRFNNNNLDDLEANFLVVVSFVLTIGCISSIFTLFIEVFIEKNINNNS